MARIAIDNFGGIAPRVHPTLLGANMAVRAHNCLLKSGKLVPIRHPAKMTGINIRMENGLGRIGDAKTLHLWRYGDGAEVLAWPGEVYVAESNLSNDKSHRLFVSGETGVGDNHPCAYIRSEDGVSVTRHDLVKDPLPAPVVSLRDGTPSDSNNIRYTAFVQTWVDEYGYESGASMPSAELEYTDGDAVYVEYCTAPALAAKRRIYKVVTGTENESIQFIKEQKAVADISFPRIEIRVKDEDAGEVLPTLQAPAKDLEMICKVPNGFYAGVSRSNRREVRFSESGNPTVWPDAYTASVGDDIVGLGVTLNTVFAITKGKPWAITGNAPDAMSAAVLASPQACVSAASICAYDGKVFYASADGICMLVDGSATVSLLTDKIFARRDWQAYKPETCKMLGHDGALFCWFLDGMVHESVVVNLLDDSSIAVTTHDEVAKAAFVDVEDDKMYFVRSVE